LNNITSHRKEMGYYLESFDQWWKIILNSGFRALVNQLSSSDLALYIKEHSVQIAKLIKDEGIWLNVEVIFAVALNKGKIGSDH
jgi:hypothetical protein